MSQSDVRRFTILDAMVLVGAVAVGLAMTRTFGVLSLAQRLGMGSAAIAWCLSLALVPLRLVRPRPARERLWRQPGWLVGVNVGLTMVVLLAFVVVSRFETLQPWGNPDPVPIWVVLGNVMVRSMMGTAMLPLAAAWLTLVGMRQWEPEPSWVDRLGRYLGVYWLVAPILVTAMPYLAP